MKIRGFLSLSVAALLLCSALQASSLKEYVAKGSPPQWMKDQIESDFSPYGDCLITSEEVDRIFKEIGGCDLPVRCKIRKGVISFDAGPLNHSHSRILGCCQWLRALARSVKLPDLDCVIVCGDGGWDAFYSGLGFPVLVFSNNVDVGGRTILIPDFEVMENAGFYRSVKRDSAKYRWERKIPVCVWRGSTTGGFFTEENYRSFPRTRLVELSLENPEFIDARFTSLCQGAENLRVELAAYFGPSMRIQEHFQYKYQITVDGNTSAWQRTRWQLYSNCVMFKRESPWKQWYFGAMEPYVHYIPVSGDLSDLIEKLRWARDNDARCRQIAIQATQFAEENINASAAEYYLYLVLMEYAKLQKF